MSDEIQVTVRRPRGTLGPMSLEALANLVAEGNVAPTDLISDGGPWVRVEDYAVQETERPEDRAAVVDSLFEDDFEIELGGPRGAAPSAEAAKSSPSPRPTSPKSLSTPSPATKSPSIPPTSMRPPASTRPSMPDVDDDDIIELLAADAPDDEDEIIDLELMDDDEPAPKPPAASAAQPTTKPTTRPVPAASPSTASPSTASTKADKPPGVRPPPLGSVKSTDSKPSAANSPTAPKSASGSKSAGGAKKPSIRPLPVPATPAGKPSGNPPGNEALTPNLPPGFRPLLNGRNLSGWEFFPLEDWTNGRSDAWSLVEGILQFDGKLKRPHLLTIPVFGDFEIFFGWRARDDKGRGGLILRADGADAETATHIVFGGPDAGALKGSGASGSKATPKLQKPAGEWNVWRVVVQGEQVKLWCNQEPAWSNGRLARPKGKIGLRAEGTPMEYKFLHVREAPGRAG